MVILYCKKCGGEKHVKAGFIQGEQRYLCKDCGCKFVPTRHHGKPEKDKLLAVWLHLHGLSFRTIAKLFKLTHKAVHDWVKAFAKENYAKPEPQGEAVIIELNEMWHFLKNKKTKSGYGRLIVAIPVNLSTGNAEGVTMLHFQSSIKDWNFGMSRYSSLMVGVHTATWFLLNYWFKQKRKHIWLRATISRKDTGLRDSEGKPALFHAPWKWLIWLLCCMPLFTSTN